MIRSTYRMMLALLVLMATVACDQKTKSSQAASHKPVKISIGLLYTGDTFPLSYAYEQGLFAAANLDVEIINFMSALERDQAFQAGSIVGMNADLIGTSLLYQNNSDAEIVAMLLGKNAGGRVAIVSSDPKIKAPKDLKGKDLGLSHNTVIEYLADRILDSHGVDSGDLRKVSMTNIPMRLNAVIANKISAAILPDPLAAMAEQQGAHEVCSDRGLDYSHAVLTMNRKFIAQNYEAVQSLLKVYNETAEMINRDPEQYREEVAKRCRVPEIMIHRFDISHYSVGELPSPKLFNDVQSWLVGRNLLPQPLDYNQVVNRALNVHASPKS